MTYGGLRGAVSLAMALLLDMDNSVSRHELPLGIWVAFSREWSGGCEYALNVTVADRSTC